MRSETFGQRYGVDPTGLVLWLDQSDPRSGGAVANWYDMSGGGNHVAQAVGGDQPAITGAIGLAGSCRDFDGNDDLMTTATTFALGIINATLTAWVYLETNSTSGAFIKVGSGDQQAEDLEGYALGVGLNDMATDGNELLALYEGIRWIDLSVSMGTGWHHAALVIGGASVPELFLDGDSIGSSAGAAPTACTHQVSGIGGYVSKNAAGDPFDRYFDGAIGQVYIAGRALTAAEIQRMYLVDKPRYGGL